MEKSITTEASELPEEMIQHIQSFLSGKEAARTTILSKSWYNAWLTRPNLDFSEIDRIWMPSEFVSFIERTLQRYDELNIKIQSCKLSMSHNPSLGKKLVEKVMKLGATDLDINGGFPLPREVLGSETLVRLSLVDVIIDVHDQKKVSCSKLKSLRLRSHVHINGNIWDVISMCPLIEELELSLCRKGVNGNSTRSYKMLVWEPESVVNDFHKLKVLSLKSMKIGEWLFRDLSSKFPCIKELTLHNCIGCKEIEICSNSLERIVFPDDGKRVLRVTFDVPRIRKFKFTSSSHVPLLSLKTASREWESDISFECINDSSRIVKLREFLSELSSSKICLDLSINVSATEKYMYSRHIICLPKPPIVEELRLRMEAPSSVQSALLEDLFWSCRPKFITLLEDLFWSCCPKFITTLDWLGKGVYKYDIVKLICNTLIKEECAMHDLEEVNVEISGQLAWTWSRNLLTKKLDALALWMWRIDIDVRLQLKWGDKF